MHLTLPKTLWSKGWHPLGAIQSGNAIFFSCKNMVPPKKVVGLEEKSLIAASFTYNVHLYSATAHLILIDKQGNTCIIIDIAVPGDSRVHEKEIEKIEKYQDLKREIIRLWKLKKAKVVPVVIGALGSVSKNFDKWMEEIGIHIGIGTLQKTALLGTSRILRKVVEM